MHAASYITTRDRQNQVLKVDMRPLVIHLIAGLEQAGLERAVVTLGHEAAEIAECVQAYGFEIKVKANPKTTLDTSGTNTQTRPFSIANLPFSNANTPVRGFGFCKLDHRTLYTIYLGASAPRDAGLNPVVGDIVGSFCIFVVPAARALVG